MRVAIVVVACCAALTQAFYIPSKAVMPFPMHKPHFPIHKGFGGPGCDIGGIGGQGFGQGGFGQAFGGLRGDEIFDDGRFGDLGLTGYYGQYIQGGVNPGQGQGQIFGNNDWDNNNNGWNSDNRWDNNNGWDNNRFDNNRFDNRFDNNGFDNNRFDNRFDNNGFDNNDNQWGRHGPHVSHGSQRSFGAPGVPGVQPF